jgi:hypothetical protein
MRFKTERDHQQLQQLVDDYLSNGGTITRTRDNRITVACPACGLRKRVSGVITSTACAIRTVGSGRRAARRHMTAYHALG